MSKRMDDLLWVAKETQRLVLQGVLPVRKARIVARRRRAELRDITAETVGDAAVPRRGGGTTKFDKALRQWIDGDEHPLRQFLLDVAEGSNDQQQIISFLTMTSDAREAVRLKEAVRVTDGQGFIADAKIRKAVEDHAMHLAKEHYQPLFDYFENTSKTEPFDYRCKNGNEEVRVEVKGSTAKAVRVSVTVAEVKNARGSEWRTESFVVR